MLPPSYSGANLDGAIFNATDISGATMADVKFGAYPMPTKPTPKQQAKAAARRLAMQLGRVVVAAEDEAAADDDEVDDDDEKEGDEETQALLTSMAEKGVDRLASAVANAVPQVIAACEKASQAIRDAVTKAETNLTDPAVRGLAVRGLDVAAAHADRESATAAVEDLLQTALGTLLGEVFNKGGTLPNLLEEAAETELGKATGRVSGDAEKLAQVGVDLGLPYVLKLVRSTVEKHAEPMLKKLAAGVAEEIDGLSPQVASYRRMSLTSSSRKVEDAADVESLLGTPLEVYRKALRTLLNRLAKCLEDPSAIAQQWMLLQGGKLLQASGGGLAALGKRAGVFQEKLKSKLSEDHAKIMPTTTELDTHMRSTIAKRALAGTSRFTSTGWKGMLALVVTTDPLVLTNNEKNLTYLLENLEKLKDAEVTSELWQDFYESWGSFLALRSQLESECAQQIFDAIATDESVLTGLGFAHALRDTVIKQGQVPNELLLQLKQGPGRHIKNKAYAYRRKIDAEITKIGRIRDLQQRAVALTGTAIVAAFVSTGNVLGRVYYDVLQSNSTMAAVIAGATVSTVLLVCLLFTWCIHRSRKRH